MFFREVSRPLDESLVHSGHDVGEDLWDVLGLIGDGYVWSEMLTG